MISLERDSNKNLVEAKGIRQASWSWYNPHQKKKFKISRSKFQDFLTCPKCFYFDRVMGLKAPGMPGWTLNETTDLLLKKEFDVCRESQTPHRLFTANGLEHLVPFKHPDMDRWRDALRGGLMIDYKTSNITLSGGVDDIWQDTKTGKLIIVDYKSQAKSGGVDIVEYLADPYHESYKVQMDFYAYLLTAMGFSVDDKAYFLVCNADRDRNEFKGFLSFEEVLVPYVWNADWIEPKVDEMISLMKAHRLPESHKSCQNCAYARQFAELIPEESDDPCDTFF